MSSDIGKLAEHKDKKPVGGAYLKSPKPFASALPPAVAEPLKCRSCPKLTTVLHYYHFYD